ncbi:phage capsid protein [Streptosporangium nondiastaticum]|uniref:Phage capsid protein n=1 Tax=Streptosporangium nondiastaticum TaxID=35764 RepID=A0A9X7JTV8_9ACTN|nr:phage portal protein [Streptosporangium nondiastaticum]PSJ29820.1 phage capsid protein [Streptosporangium nondiastaticum]
MSLPENGAPWPPPHLARTHAELRIDDAWYSGDHDKLAAVYRNNTTRGDGRPRLWGRRPSQPGKRDARLHIPLAGDIASTSADLLFSEPPTFTVTDSTTQDRLDELTEAAGVANTLLEAAEVCAALGGVYLRVTWDRELVDRPLLTVVHADCAVPEIQFGLLRAVTFWHELPSDTAAVWRHLERHERGRIVHALYQGSTDRLGERVPLTEHPEVAPLAASLGPEGDTIETGIDRLTAAYVPNIRPNRRHRGSHLGLSDYGVPLYDLFDALDTTWTSWIRDLRLARARLIVPDGYLRDHGPGRGASFDDDREIWQLLNIPPTEAGGITLSQFAIRVEEHERTAEAATRQAVLSAGYSAQTFGIGDQVAATATEVKARERKSMTTRGRKSRYWAPPVAEMLHVMLLLDQQMFTPSITPERPQTVFGDSVSEDATTLAQTLSLLQQAQAVSVDTKVRMLHPEWTESTVQEEVARILTETGAAVPDPMQAGTLV